MVSGSPNACASQNETWSLYEESEPEQESRVISAAPPVKAQKKSEGLAQIKKKTNINKRNHLGEVCYLE